MIMEKTDELFTERNVRLAVRYASRYARLFPRESAYACAEKAVRRVFGRYLESAGGDIRPERLPRYLRLVAQVESRLGLHRRRPFERLPAYPAALRVPRVPARLEAVAA